MLSIISRIMCDGATAVLDNAVVISYICDRNSNAVLEDDVIARSVNWSHVVLLSQGPALPNGLPHTFKT